MKKLVIFLAIFAVLILNIPIVHAGDLTIESTACILIDAKSGQILYEKNADEKLFPASTTKIMTAIIALENGDLDQIMTASQAAINDIGPDGMNIGIMNGEQLRLEDLLNALLVKSANETANIIAENLCPTREDFIYLMNKKAREIGALNTNFVNPCGAHNSNHYTTAGDLVKIARYAMSIPKFREIVAKDHYEMSPTNKHSTWNTLYTTNKLFNTKSEYFTQITGVKTGYTSQAGNNLVSSAVNKEGMELIAVIMDVKSLGPNKTVFTLSKDLLEYGYREFSNQKYAEANKVIKNVAVEGAVDNTSLDLITSDELSCVLPIDKSKWNIKSTEYINSSIKAPVKQGDVLGHIEYERDGVSLGKVSIIASKSIDKSSKAKFTDFSSKIADSWLFRLIFMVFIILPLAFITLRIILRRVSRSLNAKRQKN